MKNLPLRRFVHNLTTIHLAVEFIHSSSLDNQAKLVKAAQQHVDAQYEKKRKQAEVAQKMYICAP